MEPKIATKPTVKVAGYELPTTCRDGKNLQDITAFWQSLMPDKLTRLHSTLPAVQPNEYGICFPPDSATGDFSYVVALEVPDYRGQRKTPRFSAEDRSSLDTLEQMFNTNIDVLHTDKILFAGSKVSSLG